MNGDRHHFFSVGQLLFNQWSIIIIHHMSSLVSGNRQGPTGPCPCSVLQGMYFVVLEGARYLGGGVVLALVKVGRLVGNLWYHNC